MTTTWSFGLPANLPVMPPWLPFHDRLGVAVAEVMKTNASRGPGGLHQRAERKTHQPLKGVDDVFWVFWVGGREMFREVSSQSSRVLLDDYVLGGWNI